MTEWIARNAAEVERLKTQYWGQVLPDSLDERGCGRPQDGELLVVGDDHIRPRLHRGGQHVPVLGVVRHLFDERFTAGHPGVAEMFAKLASQPRRRLSATFSGGFLAMLHR